MGSGVLEPRSTKHVPGTELLQDETGQTTHTNIPLRHGRGSNSRIVLLPQPSNDPNDPLNWSSFEKHTILGILCLGALVVGVAPGPILQAGVLPISAQLGISFTDATKLAGYVLLAAGSAGIFVSALSRKFGKRPMYLLSSLVSIVGCIIGETSQTYHKLIAARVIQGLGVSAYESLIISSIGDLFFVHERGPRVALVAFILATVTNGVLIIAGPITENLGWHYNFHILLPFVALQFLLVFLFVPETTYSRPTIGVGAESTSYDIGTKELGTRAGSVEHLERDGEPAVDPRDSAVVGLRNTFTQRLRVYNGVFTNKSIFKMALSPVVILSNVGALWTIILSGMIIAWYIAISVITSVVFSTPPYLMRPSYIGYASVAPVIGGFIGSLLYAFTADPIVKFMSKKNKGVYEPEFRLPLMVPAFVTTIAGLAGIGYAIADVRSVYIICIPWAILLIGVNLVAETTTGYALDAFAENTTEIFIMNMLFKNFFYYGLTTYVIDWFLTQGPINMFWTIAGISATLLLTTIPMYVWGKKWRSFWHRNDLIKKLGLESEDRQSIRE